jgi:hypothetical protein
MPETWIGWTDEEKERLKILVHEGKGLNDLSQIMGRTKESIRKMIKRTGLKLKYKYDNSGDKHPNWKGDSASLSSIHVWIRKHKPDNGICEVCGKTNCRIECANISGEYRRDVEDYMYLCRSCHVAFDKIMPKLWNGFKKWADKEQTVVKICENCGKEYTSRFKESKYCGIKCRMIMKHKFETQRNRQAREG